MIIRDKIEEHNLFFVEQDLPNCTFYEIYHNNEKLFQIKNKFETALAEWCKIINSTLSKEVDNVNSLR